MMTKEEISKAIQAGITAAFADPMAHCRYSIDPDAHQKQHEAVTRFMETMDQINAIKWDFLRKLVWFLFLALAAFFGYRGFSGG